MDPYKNKTILYLACRQLGMNVSPNEQPDNLMRLLLCEPVIPLTPTTFHDEKTFCITKAKELRATSLMSRETIQEEVARLWLELKEKTVSKDMLMVPRKNKDDDLCSSLFAEGWSVALSDRKFYYFQRMQ